MTGKRLLLLVVGLLGAFALAAAGCGGGDETSTGGAGTSGGETGTAANQTMTIAWGAEPDGFAVRDGSGLSRHDYVSPRTLVKALDAMRRGSALARRKLGRQ